MVTDQHEFDAQRANRTVPVPNVITEGYGQFLNENSPNTDDPELIQSVVPHSRLHTVASGKVKEFRSDVHFRPEKVELKHMMRCDIRTGKILLQVM